MNQTIYVIGTTHKYQHLSSELSEDAHSSFRKMTKSVVADHCILMIAEESNTEALAKICIPKSALQLIAKEVGAKHLFTEAELSYRVENGMEQEKAIRISGFMNDLSEIDIEGKVRESHRARECHWFKQILSADLWPVLFVCGAIHAIEFNSLVSNSSITGVLLNEDWNN